MEQLVEIRLHLYIPLEGMIILEENMEDIASNICLNLLYELEVKNSDFHLHEYAMDDYMQEFKILVTLEIPAKNEEKNTYKKLNDFVNKILGKFPKKVLVNNEEKELIYNIHEFN